MLMVVGWFIAKWFGGFLELMDLGGLWLVRGEMLVVGGWLVMQWWFLVG